MLRSAKEIIGYRLQASDGELGKVQDFLFDDQWWAVRYLVADTARWLAGRRVLIAPAALGQPDWARRHFPVSLTRGQIENCPGIEQDRPVSRQHEHELTEYYGWPRYWGALSALEPWPAPRPIPLADAPRDDEKEPGDSHLRSATEVRGYRIAATDGEIGHLDDLILDDLTWWIRYVVVDTRNWLPGRHVLVSPDWFSSISWIERTVGVDLSREKVRHSPEFRPSTPINRHLEERLYDFYGRPVYWAEDVGKFASKDGA
jgi:hypothetical protein